jgi:fermentation-respiration switch protein FrsA (DUF1100 family)
MMRCRFFLFATCASAWIPGCARPASQQLVAPVPTSAAEPDDTVVVENFPPEAPPAVDLSEASLPIKSRSFQTLDERILFQPSDASRGNYRPRNLRFEDVSIQAADGTELHGWYCPCDNPRAYVLFCHGNSGNVAIWSGRMAELQKDYRVSVFIFDYRGYGKSQGRPTVPGVLMDARAAAKALAKKAGVNETDIVVMGQSLGGAVAAHLAAEIHPRGLILESTFATFREVADHHAKWASWMVPRDRLNSAGQIGKYKGPVLQCHGDKDSVVPFASGQKLFEAANEPKMFITMPGGDHLSPLSRQYRWQLDDFFEQLPRKTGS